MNLSKSEISSNFKSSKLSILRNACSENVGESGAKSPSRRHFPLSVLASGARNLSKHASRLQSCRGSSKCLKFSVKGLLTQDCSSDLGHGVLNNRS
jgi:hypothetical protein